MDIQDIQQVVLENCSIKSLVQTRLVCKNMNRISNAFLIKDIAYRARKTQDLRTRKTILLVCSSDLENKYYDFFAVDCGAEQPAFSSTDSYMYSKDGETVSYHEKAYSYYNVLASESVLDAVLTYLDIEDYDYSIAHWLCIEAAAERKCKKLGLEKVFYHKIMDKVMDSLSELPEHVFEKYMKLKR